MCKNIRIKRDGVVVCLMELLDRGENTKPTAGSAYIMPDRVEIGTWYTEALNVLGNAFLTYVEKGNLMPGNLSMIPFNLPVDVKTVTEEFTIASRTDVITLGRTAAGLAKTNIINSLEVYGTRHTYTIDLIDSFEGSLIKLTLKEGDTEENIRVFHIDAFKKPFDQMSPLVNGFNHNQSMTQQYGFQNPMQQQYKQPWEQMPQQQYPQQRYRDQPEGNYPNGPTINENVNINNDVDSPKKED